MELLAPAGNMENLKIAIKSGADAIYLSGKNFGARAYAQNFSNDELKEAVVYCHKRNKKIYVTVNTLIKNTELHDLVSYLKFLDEISVDGIILQDLSIVEIVKNTVPNLPLHASTQMTINNLSGVLALKKLGFRRVVLSRELSLEDIKEIVEKSGIEIEIFGHGAICVSYSGQCLLSSMVADRSGNRGRCAQPCRLPYQLVNKNGEILNKDIGNYLLSPKDMNTIDYVKDFMKFGVASIKLEGRMKNPDYVAIVVGAYRQKIDEINLNSKVSQAKYNLDDVFNRGYTHGYLTKEIGQNMMAYKKPNNKGKIIGQVISYDKNTLKIKLEENLTKGDILFLDTDIKNENITIEKNYQDKNIVLQIKNLKSIKKGTKIYRIFNKKLMDEITAKNNDEDKFPLDIKITGKKNEKLHILGKSNEFTFDFVTDFIVPKAKKNSTDCDLIKKQLSRLGNSSYYLRDLECELDENIMIPTSVLNDSRRFLVQKLDELRINNFKRDTSKISIYKENCQKDIGYYHYTDTQITVLVDSLKKAEIAIFLGVKNIIFGGDIFNHRKIFYKDYENIAKICNENNVNIYFATNRVMRNSQEEAFIEFLTKIKDLNISGIYAHNLGQIHLIKKYTTFPILGDFSLNILNEESLKFLKNQGLSSATISLEATYDEIKKMAKKEILPIEILVHGYTETMVSEYCVLGAVLGGRDSGSCSMPCIKDEYFLKDRKNMLIPIKTDSNCHMHLLNPKILNMLRYIYSMKENKIAKLRIDGRNFSEDKLAKIIKIYMEVLELGKNHDIFQDGSIEYYEENITRGHYFRDIL